MKHNDHLSCPQYEDVRISKIPPDRAMNKDDFLKWYFKGDLKKLDNLRNEHKVRVYKIDTIPRIEKDIIIRMRENGLSIQNISIIKNLSKKMVRKIIS